MGGCISRRGWIDRSDRRFAVRRGKAGFGPAFFMTCIKVLGRGSGYFWGIKEEDDMYKNILLPIAPDHERDTDAALQAARTLLDEGGTMTALMVIEPVPVYAASLIPPEILQDNLKDLEARLLQRLDGAEDVTPIVKIGSPGRVIADYAKETGADLLVVASHRPGLTDIFLGSTAAWLVRHATCSVHVMR